MNMNKKKIFACVILIILVIQSVMPLISKAADSALNVELTRNQNIINVVATSDVNITKLEYVHKDVEPIYFQEEHDDITEINITPSTRVTSTIQMNGYGTYSVYAEDTNGSGFLSKITVNDPAGRPEITVNQDENNPLKLNILVTAKDSPIVELKIAKKSSMDEEIDLSDESVGEKIDIVSGQRIETSYTLSEEGIYAIYARTESGSSTTFTTAIAATFPLSIEVTQIDKLTVNIKAKSNMSNIAKIKYATASEISGLDDFKTKGTEIPIESAKELDLDYEMPAEGTYWFYIEDEIGYRKMTQLTVISEDQNLMWIDIDQDESNPKLLHITAGSQLSDIVEMKYLIGTGVELEDVKNYGDNLEITPGQEVSTDLTVEHNCTVNIYIKDENEYGYFYSKTITGIDDITDKVPPEITLKQDTDNLRKINVTVTDESYIRRVKYAEGSQDVTYFENNGIQIGQGSLGSTIDTSFEIDKVGIYTVYAEDNEGNKSVEEINILSIDEDVEDTTPPEIEATINSPVGNRVKVDVIIKDESSLEVAKIAKGNQKEDYFADNGQLLELDELSGVSRGSFEVSENGEYTIYAQDIYGNVTLKVITIDSIEIPDVDETAPAIGLQKELEGDRVKVNLTVTDGDSGVYMVKIAEGNQTEDYFANNGESIEIEQGTEVNTYFYITENGTYTVFAQDSYGNKTVEVFEVTEIVDVPDPDNNTIDNNTVDNNTVDNNTVDNNTVDNNTVDNNTIDNNTVDNNTVDNNTADNNTVDNNTVDNNTVDNNTVDNNTVDNNTVDNNTVDNNTVDNNTVDNNTVDNNTVDNNTIDNNTVDNNTVDNNTVDNNTVDNNTVDNNSADNTIPGNDNSNNNTDNTMSEGKYPYTGIGKTIIIGAIIFLVGISGVSYIKYRKLK